MIGKIAEKAFLWFVALLIGLCCVMAGRDIERNAAIDAGVAEYYMDKRGVRFRFIVPSPQPNYGYLPPGAIYPDGDISTTGTITTTPRFKP